MARSDSRWRRLDFLELESRITPTGGFPLTPGWNVWQPISPAELSWAQAAGATAWQPLAATPLPSGQLNGPQWYLPVALDEAATRAILEDAPFESQVEADDKTIEIALARPDGRLERFEIWQVPTLDPQLAASYPGITTYRGQGIDDPAAILAADFTYQGFHAQVFSSEGGYSIEPTQAISTGTYRAYFHADYASPHGGGCGCAECLAAAVGQSATSGDPGQPSMAELVNGANRRTFRLAVAATGEFTSDAGGSAVAALSAITTVVNSVNAIYERDLAIRFTLVANNDLLIYTNAGTDPYTGNDGGAMLGENQANIDAVIGSANYDIGHVFTGINLGGVANLGVVGNAGSKARGVSSTDSTNNTTSYWMTIVVSHEIGHQFAAGHTFNGSSTALTPNRMSNSAWEPGSGSTIMAYGHIGEGNGYVSISDSYFHSGTIGQILNFVATISNVGTTTATGNTVPTANAGADRTIPANSFFELTGTSTDADGDALTFTWEQLNLGASLVLGSADNGSSPLFRSYAPNTSKTRSFRALSDILANTSRPSEVMPTTARSLTFRFTARDNKAGNGAVSTDDVKLTTVNTGAPFRVTSPNTGSVVWATGSSQTVTWDVAGTTANGINAANVRILLSTDGGLTYPITLLASTPNDGSQSIVVPVVDSKLCRIRVQPTANYFFDVSDANFTIASFTPGDTLVTNANDSGPGSLRSAVTNANLTVGPDTITFSPSVFGSLTSILLTSGPIVVTDALSIAGPAGSVTIDGGGLSQILRFSVPSLSAVNISNVNFTNGKTAGGGNDQGAAVNLSSNAIASFFNCSFTGNSSASNGGAIFHAGGDSGQLLIEDCSFTNNSAAVCGGAIAVNNGFGSAATKITLVDSTLSGNSAGFGGGVYFVGVANVSITRSLLVGNRARDGAGLFTLGSFLGGAPATTVVVTSSSLVGNTAFRGAGLLVQSRTNLAVESSTLSGNVTTDSPDGRGAGIAFLGFDAVDAEFSMRNSTVTNNTAAGILDGGAIYLDRLSNRPVTIANTVIAGNIQPAGAAPDLLAPALASGGNNLIGVMSADATTFGGSGNLIGTISNPVDAKLGPLADHGGPTPTHLPLPGSPLIDAAGATTITTDQRGSARVSGLAADIGASELQRIGITDIKINDGSAQRSRVTSLTVTFDAVPILGSNVFTLTRQSDSAAVTLTTSIAGNSVTLGFAGGPVEFGGLADGRYTLGIAALGVNQGGLDGDGDGSAGDDFLRVGTPANGLYRLFGDMDADGTVTTADFLALRTVFLGPSFGFDYDGDGQVTPDDFLAFRVRFLKVI